MLANFEKREGKERAWTGRYENLHNLPHWHLEFELIYIEKGSVTVSLNHTAYDLHSREAALIESGEIHYIKGEPGSITSILMFDGSIIQEITRRAQLASPLLDSWMAALIPGLCQTVKNESKEKQPFYELKITSLIRSLLVDIYRCEALSTHNLVEPKANRFHTSMENYKNLLSEIEEKYSYLTFADASSFMGLSQPYFSKFFKNISGMTFSRYLNIIRLEKAIDMLRHNTKHLSITEIATLCGFDTIRHFNRTFKEMTGFSPRELPEDYVLTSRSIKSMKGNFNPTLSGSRLLD